MDEKGVQRGGWLRKKRRGKKKEQESKGEHRGRGVITCVRRRSPLVCRF